MIAVLILTTGDSETLSYCVHSFLEHEAEFKIYLVYQGDCNHSVLVERLREKGHYVYTVEHDKVTKLRNKCLQEIDEEYLLRADDDMIIDKNYKIGDMIEFIKRSPGSFVSDLEVQIGNGKGLFSEEMSDGQGYLYRLKGFTIKKYLSPKKVVGSNQKFLPVDFSRNLVLSKTEDFRKVRWNEKIEFEGEHLDFMLRIKQKKYNLFTYTNSHHFHFDSLKLVNREDKHRARKGRQKLEALHNMGKILNIRSFKVYINKIILYLFTDRHE